MLFHALSQRTAVFLALLWVAITGAQAASPAQPHRILVFSKTAAFRHTSIPNGLAAIQQLGLQNNFQVVATEDAATFNDASLAQYSAVVFLMTTGDVLDAAQQAAFERFIQSGGGYVGIHSASDTEYTWPWYGELVGAYFKDHPAIQSATVRMEDPEHPSTRSFSAPWVRSDEWYNFQTNPRTKVHVLAVLDETTYSGGTMGDHPIAWYHAYDGGRSWYTAGGHTPQSYSEPAFRAHLLGGIQYAAGMFVAPPEGAVVLFDGKDQSQWTRPAVGQLWDVSDGVLTIRPGSGGIRTVQTFLDYQLHLEFRFPSTSPAGTTENALANSGVFLQNQFEIQIIESYGRAFSGSNDGAALWSLRDASTNASLPGGTWESFDITYRAARWVNGVKTENARVTVYWNGVAVHENIEIPRPTPNGAPPEQPPPDSIGLQDLVGVVQFRNIWLLPLNQPNPPGPRFTHLIPTGSNWKYLDDGSNQGAAWRQLGFDDSAWKKGTAELGYGDGDETTVIGSNRLDNSRIQTTYFRKEFVVTNVWALTNVAVGLLRDDGGIVYLNGNEVFRSNMTNAPTVYHTNWASTAVGNADETAFFSTNISASLLVNGTNVLAVEIHQASASSTDVSFDFWLTALTYPTPQIGINRTGSQLDLLWPLVPGGFVLEGSPALGPSATWVLVGDATLSTTNGFQKSILNPGPGSLFYRLRRP